MPAFSKTAQVALALALPSSVLLLYWWYRRSLSEEDGFGQSRVVTSRSIVIEVPVPQRAVGAVIGKQGSTIKQIQKESGARLRFKDREGSNGGDRGDGLASTTQAQRTVVIHGSVEAAQQAELMIYQIIAELPEILTEEIEVPQYSIGRLIGKGGKSIREMNHASKAKIEIGPPDHSKGPDDLRVITLVGSRKEIDIALELIQEKLEEEEKLRAKLSISAANRQHRKADKTGTNQGTRGGQVPEHPAKVQLTSVARDDDGLWDELSSQTSRQDKLPQIDGFMEVFVSAVEHPGHFWVQVVGSRGLQLEQIQIDVTSFVQSEEAQINYRVTTVETGELVAAKFDTWDPFFYRAKILGEGEGGTLDLYFVDYGDNSFVPKEEVYKLRSDLVSFPYQAIECQLANVEPIDGHWTDPGITCFEDLVSCAQWKVVSARVLSHCRMADGQLRPLVQLIDNNDNKDLDVGKELVRRGFAKYIENNSKSTKISS